MKLVRFAADSMLGRLARWLRLLGHDTAYEPSYSDSDLIRLSIAEERVVLTRDRELARLVPAGRVVLLRATRLEEQLVELRAALALEAEAALSRCSICNEPVVETKKEDVRDRVPPYVYATQDEFYRCPRCERLYWRGTHWENVRAILASIGLSK